MTQRSRSDTIGAVTRSESSSRAVAVRQAWRDVRTALDEPASTPASRYHDPAIRAALERAWRTAPLEMRSRLARREDGVVELAPFYTGQAAPPTTSSTEADLWARAARLARALRDALEVSRRAQRQAATDIARDAATAAEQGITAILRPLGAALADATTPLASGLGGAGMLLAVLTAAYLLTRSNR